MTGTVILWGHALAALLFAGLAVSQLRDGAASVPRTAFLAALGLTALWALAVAGTAAIAARARQPSASRRQPAIPWAGRFRVGLCCNFECPIRVDSLGGDVVVVVQGSTLDAVCPEDFSRPRNDTAMTAP